MHPDRTRSHDPAEPKRCSACGEEKRAADFYVSRGRLSSYCPRAGVLLQQERASANGQRGER